MLESSRTLFILCFILFSGPLSAQTVNSLFSQEAMLTHIGLPFEVKSSSPVSIGSVTFNKNTGECIAVVDKFRSNIYHVKCFKAGTFAVKLTYQSNDSWLEKSLPPIEVSESAGSVVPEEPGKDLDFEDGKNLFNSYCLRCHTPSSKRNYTAVQIDSAMTSQSSMKSDRELSDLRTNLSPAELQAMYQKMAAYLGSL